MLEPLAIFIFGLIIGSFCNVVIYRFPQGKSIVTPGSHCPSCAAPNFISYRDRSRVAALIATGNSARGALAAAAADDADSLYPTAIADAAALNLYGSTIPTTGYTLTYARTGTPAGWSYTLVMTHTATSNQV